MLALAHGRRVGASTRMNIKNIVFSGFIFVASIMLGLGALEVMLRVKNASMKNYDVEMWRYSKELKTRSDNHSLGHLHLKNRSAILQGVNIRTNEWGLRGPPLGPRDPAKRRVLFLGSSITLGWGVPEEETVSARVEQALKARGENVEVLNGGIGNYNSERYVERFFVELKELQPSDVVVQYFLRDAEDLGPGRDNFILRNSELAAVTWIAASQLIGRTGEASLIEHYRAVYQEDQPGYHKMLVALKKLADYAKANNIRIYMTMVPDVHNLKQYPFGFIHDRMQKIAADMGYTYVDLLGALGSLTPEEIWAMPGDPHPNSLGHKLMADAITPVLARADLAHRSRRLAGGKKTNGLQRRCLLCIFRLSTSCCISLSRRAFASISSSSAARSSMPGGASATCGCRSC